MPSVDELIEEGLGAPISGWDFSWLTGRATESKPPWDYPALVREAANASGRVLDVDTGGGEALSRILPLPGSIVATEGFEPNVAVAGRRLGPQGISVVHSKSAPDNVDQLDLTPSATHSRLPFRDGAFDLVIDRHSSYWPSEVHRVLAPGGRFITQQRSEAGELGATLKELFQRDEEDAPAFDLGFAVNQLAREGFEVARAEEADTPLTFFDLPAVVYYLRMAPWAVADFDPDTDRDALDRIYDRLRREERLVVRGCHLLVVAAKA
jgi:SAM-dependent methyltransferase